MASWQLAGLDFGRGAIQGRIARGYLHRLYRGVYAVGHPVIAVRGRWMAAVLACGRDAVLSHRDAAALWGLRPSSSRNIDVTAPGRTRRGQRGIVLHSVRRLDPAERGTQDGIPVTSVARTLLDLAEVVNARQLERAFDEAERLRLFDLRAMEAVVANGHGRRGLAALRTLLEEKRPAPPMTRSELERAFLDFCRAHDLPLPAMNLWIAGHEVDAVWVEERLVAELDSYAFHASRAAFEDDRERDADLQLAGYRPIRVTDRMMTRTPGRTAGRIRALLSAAAAAR